MTTHFLIIATGSGGDVLPLLTLGSALRARGHDVTMLAHGAYEPLILAEAINFVPLSTQSQYEACLKDKMIVATRYETLFLIRHCVDWNATIYRTAKNIARNSNLKLLAGDRPGLWADLIAHAALKVPAFRVSVDLPQAFATSHCALPPSPVQNMLFRRLQLRWRTEAMSAGCRAGPGQHLRSIRSLRPRVPTIALWPIGVAPEFVGRHGIHAFGFIPPPRSADNNPDIPYEHCERKTLVFVSGTPGTTREWFQSFLGTSIQVCSRLERNGILLGGSGRTQVPDLPPFFSYRDHLPLGRVLKNAVAIVHHGGIGTAATAIEAGVAQLIVPRVFAQPHNAERLRRLGVCSVISPQNYSCPLAVSEIVRLLHDSSFIERAGILSAMSPPAEQRVRSVCEFLETERADKSRAPVDQAAAK